MKFQVSAVHAREKYLQELLGQRPEAQIVHVLSHDQRIGFRPIIIEGEPFRDEFGLQVFLSQLVDWHGELTDLDERYEGTGMSSDDFL